MNKEFVSFEIAKELSELSFVEGCIAWFDPVNRKFNILGQEDLDKWHTTFKTPEIIQAPLISQVFRWFREMGFDYAIYVNDEKSRIHYEFVYDNGTQRGDGSGYSNKLDYYEIEMDLISTMIEIVKTTF